jgi:calcineurin-like phosphoesterase family protein
LETKDWYDDWIEEGEMNVYLLFDPHFNHDKEGGVMQTHCQRPVDFSTKVAENWRRTVKPSDLIIVGGDIFIGSAQKWRDLYPTLPGRKIGVRGNHDRNHGNTWWMENGFDFMCDGFMFRHAWITHEPSNTLPPGAEINIHGHLHNIWDGFHNPARIERDKELLGVDFTKQLKHSWQRLFAVEYTNYMPVSFDKFVSHPDKYQSRGPRKENG